MEVAASSTDVHRLRDLDRRQAAIAAALIALLLVPFIASAVRANRVEWLPSGDDALIGLRAHDVFTEHRPLIGQPSTSHLYGPEQGTAHPGPIEFYWLAVPLRVFGPAVGMILGSLAFNLAGVLIAAWVVLRRAGPRVAAWSAVVLSGVLWSEGTAILSDPISSNAGGIPLLALAALAWAVADGDHRLLPLGALVGSWVVQQHLAISLPATSMVLFGVGGAALGGLVGWRNRRRGSVDEIGSTPAEAHADADADADSSGAPSPPDPPASDRAWPWVLAALLVAALCWSPVLWQQATADRGNISAVIEYATHGESETGSIGAVAGARQAVRAFGVPPVLVRSDLTGRDFFSGPLSPLETASAVAVAAILAATVVLQRRRRRTLALLCLTALVLAAAGAVNGSTIPDSIEQFRINFYRWAFVVAWLTWIALGWLATIGVRAVLDRRHAELPRALPRLAPLAAIAIMAIPAIATVATAGDDDARRDQSGFPTMRAMAAAAVDVADEGGAERVTLVLRGRSAVLASGPALTLQLEAAGFRVVLPDQQARFYGDQRILEPGDDPGEVILLLVTGRGSVPDGPGRTVARVDMNEAQRAPLEQLVAMAAGEPVRPSADAEQILAEFAADELEAAYLREVMTTIEDDPEALLTNELLLEIVAAGYFESPAFDPEVVDELQRSLPTTTVNEDDVFELRVLTADDLAEVVPAWAEG